MMKEGKQAFACDHVNDEHLSLKYPYEQHGFSAAVPVLAVVSVYYISSSSSQ